MKLTGALWFAFQVLPPRRFRYLWKGRGREVAGEPAASEVSLPRRLPFILVWIVPLAHAAMVPGGLLESAAGPIFVLWALGVTWALLGLSCLKDSAHASLSPSTSGGPGVMTVRPSAVRLQTIGWGLAGMSCLLTLGAAALLGNSSGGKSTSGASAFVDNGRVLEGRRFTVVGIVLVALLFLAGAWACTLKVHAQGRAFRGRGAAVSGNRLISSCAAPGGCASGCEAP